MEEKRPLLLLSNDDGVTAKGIKVLIDILRPLGDIVVMAPDGARSGCACGLTVSQPIHYQLVSEEPGLTIYKCSGTPVDCIKLAMHTLLDRKPDVVVSGINHGDNSSINVHYSGTMGVAIEGCLCGIPSVGFSLCDHHHDASFEPLRNYIFDIVKNIIDNGLPKEVCLNVNFPLVDEIKGVKVCTQAKGYWNQEFDPCPRKFDDKYFWLAGHFVHTDDGTNTNDRTALDHGYATITPLKVDVSAYEPPDQTAAWCI